MYSRDQIIARGYFSSVTRANTRLRELTRAGFLKRLETPFFGQSLYIATKAAAEVVGGEVASLVSSRTGSPRFLQHTLAVTNVRIALSQKAQGEWRFEQQLWRRVGDCQIRPDGLFIASSPVFVEVDMGHVAPSKFKEKLLGYQTLAHSGQCSKLYSFPSFRVLTVTTGSLRANRLRRLLPPDPGFEFQVRTFDEVGAARPSLWS